MKNGGSGTFNCTTITVPEIEGLFSEESKINTLIVMFEAEGGELVIDRDLIIPKGCSIWLNINTRLRIEAWAALTIYGELETFQTPIIDGIILGEITRRRQG